MNIKLLFQRVFFKKEEWEKFRFFLKDLNFEKFLLSKEVLFPELKELKFSIVGECLIIIFPLDKQISEIDNYKKILNFIDLLKQQYNNKLYFIGFFLEYTNKVYLLNIYQIKKYLSYYDYKRNEKEGYNINIITLKELIKILKSINLIKKMYVTNKQNLIFTKHYSFYY